MGDVFRIFLRLGLTSFGGPIAHLGYFRREFVERRAWLDEPTFAGIVAFCSVLPGPTSSQTGMLIGLTRAGAGGAFAAWLGFTAPSAIAMTLVALGLHALRTGSGMAGSAWFAGLLAGLTAAAAAVVAQAVLALARTLCTDRATQTIALGATMLAIAIGGSAGLAWLPIALGAVAGGLFLRGTNSGITTATLPVRISRRTATGGAIVFLLIVALLFVPERLAAPPVALLETIVRAGTLVFGGGHVVLPLLQDLVGNGLLPAREFFAGYGVAQALPGPLFTFAAFIGAANASVLSGVPGAFVATVAVFVPSFALIFALAPVWNRVCALPGAAAALRGANASVVGLLAGVLYHPMLTSLEANARSIGIALAAYALIDVWKFPPWSVVVASALLGAAAGAFA
ncbi:MAG TPA: chromate efflux transporter [Candidatus Lustribacter sp.]